MDLRRALLLIAEEYSSATEKFKPFNSPHEGYAVILEELDELWLLVKSNQTSELMKKEAIQVGAMAIRFMLDCCNK